MKKQLYFCYGSNLNVEQMRRRCPDAEPLCRASLPDYRLEFRGNATGYGVATVVPEAGSTVPGGLWLISARDLIALDRYEGYPLLYTRGPVRVVKDDGEVVEALTYWMTPGHVCAKPSEFYVRTILQGYIDFGLNTRDFVDQLMECYQ